MPLGSSHAGMLSEGLGSCSFIAEVLSWSGSESQFLHLQGE